MHGHGAHDAQKYVPAPELEQWQSRDPLTRWRERAEHEIRWSPAQQAELERRVSREVAAAIEDALDAPYPDIDDLAQSVFA
jgi:TPP-dependent pyruvate/acetoin dehydrogenase alpha subunit